MMHFRLLKNKTVEPTLETSTKSGVENVCNQDAHSEKKESFATAVIVLAFLTTICFLAFLAILIVHLKKTRNGKYENNLISRKNVCSSKYIIRI